MLIISCSLFSLPQSFAQKIQPMPPIQNNGTDVFRVDVTVFGVNKNTGSILTFVKVDSVTSARYYNASKDDLKDGNGIVDSLISFPNTTVNTGANFTACNVVLKDINMFCKTGLNVNGRIEFIQFVLPTFEQNLKK